MSEWMEDVGQWARFLEASGLSPNTIRQYRRSVVNFVADTLMDLADVTEQDLVDYLVTFPARGHARGGILRAFRSLFAWRERRRGVPNPAAALKPTRAKYGAAPSLTEDELTRLIVAAAWRSERRAWAILFFYGTGVRLASACAVRPEDIHAATLHLRVAKGGRLYSVPLGRVARAAVEGLLPTANGTLMGAGPGRVWEWIHQAGEDCGFRAHPHLLRHTFATRLLERGADVRTLQELGGWADLSQIPRYTTVTDPRKREAVDLL